MADTSGRPTAIQLCTRCGVLRPVVSSYVAQNDPVLEQATYHAEVWSDFGPETAEQLRKDVQGIVDSFRRILGEPSDSPVFEIGCGRGGLLAALKGSGYRVRGCEPSEELVAKARKGFDFSKEELTCCGADEFLNRVQAEGSLGHVFIWHVIEHVVDPLGLMRRIASIQKPDSYVILQGPCLLPEHVFPEHYMFPTEPAIHALAKNCGYDIERIEYDYSLGFITFVYRRNHDVVPEAWVELPQSMSTSLAMIVERHAQQHREQRLMRDLAAARILGEDRYAAVDRQRLLLSERERTIFDLERLVANERIVSQDEAQRRVVAEEEIQTANRMRWELDTVVEAQRVLIQQHEARILHLEQLLEHAQTTSSRAERFFRRLVRSS